MAKKSTDADPLVLIVSSEIAGQLLMITPTRVRQLTKDGWITKIGKDQYRLGDVVQGYLRFRNSEDRRSSQSASESRVRDARTSEIELRVGERARTLTKTDDAVAAMEMVVGFIRSELSGFAASITRDLGLRRLIDAGLNNVLRRVVNHLRKEIDLIRAGHRASRSGGPAYTGPVGGQEPDLPAVSGGAGSA